MGTFQHKVRTNYCKKLLFVVSLQKKTCTRQFESKLSLRSFAFSLQKKSCISAKYSSKLDILHSICIFFASSTKESVTRASQGHLLRPKSVTIDDQRRSSIKTPKEHYSKTDRRHRATNKTPDTRAVTNAPTIS